MNVLLRSASVLALAAASLAASAQATYTIVDPGVLNATILAAAPPTATTTYLPPAVTGTLLGQALNRGTLTFSTPTLFDFSFTSVGGVRDSTSGGYFPIDLLTRSGTATNNGVTFTSVVNPAPEPSALAALSLGALAFVRRRRGA